MGAFETILFIGLVLGFLLDFSTQGWGQAIPTPTSSPLPTFTPNPAGTDYSKVVQDLEDFIPDQMNQKHVKGLSIALVDGDKVVWMKGFGYADSEKRIQANADTLYHVGAVSKIFTAAEVLKLAQKGKMGLDTPVRNYIPGFSIHSRFKHAKAITVRSLLANHSGLPGFYLKGIWVDHPESIADLVGDLKNDYLVSPPQTLYKYSYTDYAVLGRAVELRRKKDFAQAMKEDLFDPLGMDSSSFDNSSDTDPRLAQGYRHGDAVTLIHLRDVPAAGMVSSARDLARFLQFVLEKLESSDATPHPDPSPQQLSQGNTPAYPQNHGQGARGTGLDGVFTPSPLRGEGGVRVKYSGDSLSLKSLQNMFTPAYPGLLLDFGHQVGLGWQLSGIKIPGAEGVAWHDGKFPPYNAEMVALYRQGLGLVFLSNSEEGDDLCADVTTRALKQMLQAKYGIPADLKKKEIKMPPTVVVAPEQLDQDTGYYSALGQLMKITRHDGQLEGEWDNHNLDLLPVSQDTFVPHITFIFFPIDLPQFPLTFLRVNGQPMATLGGFALPIPLQGIKPVDIPDAWKEREGNYELENPDGVFQFSRITLGENEGFLTVDMKVSFPVFDMKDKEFKVALLPLSDEDALIPGLFYGDGGTLHASRQGDEEEVFYSGYWYKKKPGPGTPVAPTTKPIP